VPDRPEQASLIEPVDPAECRELHVLQALPATTIDQLGLVEPVDRFGERVVIRVADAPDRGRDAGLGQAFRVPDRRSTRSAAECWLREGSANFPVNPRDFGVPPATLGA